MSSNRFVLRRIHTLHKSRTIGVHNWETRPSHFKLPIRNFWRAAIQQDSGRPLHYCWITRLVVTTAFTRIYTERLLFPLQLVVMLGQQGRDWEGGEFVLVENVPRAQSRAEVITADQGHGIIFTTRYRPVEGSRGPYRVSLRHGVSRIRRGTRYTLGIIYHDAK